MIHRADEQSRIEEKLDWAACEFCRQVKQNN